MEWIKREVWVPATEEFLALEEVKEPKWWERMATLVLGLGLGLTLVGSMVLYAGNEKMDEGRELQKRYTNLAYELEMGPGTDPEHLPW